MVELPFFRPVAFQDVQRASLFWSLITLDIGKIVIIDQLFLNEYRPRSVATDVTTVGATYRSSLGAFVCAFIMSVPGVICCI